MNIYLLLAHPDKQSFNSRLADAYEQQALSKGHEVRRQNLGDLHFQPVLHKGYKEIQAWEPDLEQAWQNISWCQEWVIIYPVWWGSVPALLKGFLDRVLLPGLAFHYHEKDPFWDKLLKGRSARLIATSDAPASWLWWQYRNSDLHMLKDAVLKFCGFSPVRVLRIDRVKYRSEEQRIQKIDRVIYRSLNIGS